MRPAPSSATTLDTLVVGAGPAGIGTAIALSAIDDLVFGVVDRGVIGQTFLDWPEEQTLLTPSFTGNGFGATDLNAVHFATSPAFTLGTDYPTGREYARYLRAVATHFRLPIMTNTEVLTVDRTDDVFVVQTSRGPVRTRALVWAAGEFGQPRIPKIVGNGLLEHSSAAGAWGEHGDDVVIVGGNESGIDLACHHAATGASVRVFDPATPWEPPKSSDPSLRLAPRSRLRLDATAAAKRITLDPRGVRRVRRSDRGFTVQLDDGSTISTSRRPIAATGFRPAFGPIHGLVDERPDGLPRLTEDDESTTTPGLFFAGPSLRHGAQIFCFIYKFRQRFAHVAGVIASRAGYDRTPLEQWRDHGMLTDDLSCCGIECAC